MTAPLTPARLAEIEAMTEARTSPRVLHSAIRDLLAEREWLMCRLDGAYMKIADAYQVVGNLLDRLGEDAFESPAGQRALDYFADCEAPAQEGFLPWLLDEGDLKEPPHDD